jgi:hypothetical protein
MLGKVNIHILEVNILTAGNVDTGKEGSTFPESKLSFSASGFQHPVPGRGEGVAAPVQADAEEAAGHEDQPPERHRSGNPFYTYGLN